MSPSLFPTFTAAPIDPAPASPERLYGTGYRWNFFTGDFEVDGNGRLIEIDEQEQFAEWCVLALLVERNAHPVYSDSFGVDKRRVIGIDTLLAEAEVQAVIEDALANSDDRVYIVGDFEFARSEGTLDVTFTVIPIEGSPLPLSFSLGE